MCSNGCAKPAPNAKWCSSKVPATKPSILVARFGTNVNQAVAALNSTGEAPPELLRVVELCARATVRADEVVARIQRRLP